MDIFVPYGVKTTLALSPEKFTLCITIEVISNWNHLSDKYYKRWN